MLRTIHSVVLAFTALAIFQISTASAENPERPMKMSGNGRVDCVFTAPGTGTWTVTMTGEATHLGAYSWTGAGDMGIDPASGLPAIWGSGSIEAANGDVLDYDLMIYIDWSTFLGELTATFTGGTGRFEGASGSVQATVQYVPDPETPASEALFEFDATGTISY